MPGFAPRRGPGGSAIPARIANAGAGCPRAACPVALQLDDGLGEDLGTTSRDRRRTRPARRLRGPLWRNSRRRSAFSACRAGRPESVPAPAPSVRGAAASRCSSSSSRSWTFEASAARSRLRHRLRRSRGTARRGCVLGELVGGGEAVGPALRPARELAFHALRFPAWWPAPRGGRAPAWLRPASARPRPVRRVRPTTRVIRSARRWRAANCSSAVRLATRRRATRRSARNMASPIPGGNAATVSASLARIAAASSS